MTGLEKFAVVLVVLIVGLEVYGRYTGASWRVNLLDFQAIGDKIKAARAAAAKGS